MDVYYDKNFWYRKNEGQEGISPLKKISVDAPFCWKDIEGFLPALYVGSEGAVLDVCIRVPFPEIERYFGRWTEEKRLSGLTDEEFEEMQSDSPFPSDFRIEMGLDGEELTSGSMCSTVWHTYKAEEQYADEEAEALMEEYGCDRGAGWMFTRWNYGWSGQPVLTPERMTGFIARSNAIMLIMAGEKTAAALEAKEEAQPETGAAEAASEDKAE